MNIIHPIGSEVVNTTHEICHKDLIIFGDPNSQFIPQEIASLLPCMDILYVFSIPENRSDHLYIYIHVVFVYVT